MLALNCHNVLCSITGININERAIHLAAENENVEFSKHICSYANVDSQKRSALHYAALNKNPEIIKYLFSNPNIDFNMEYIQGMKLIHCAAINLSGLFLLLALILEQGMKRRSFIMQL